MMDGILSSFKNKGLSLSEIEKRQRELDVRLYEIAKNH